ncbi:hypothetical protein DFH09DRAFT_1180073 [Mycena vulgaris]|nr:hypothetical protein DFH09DRAFT_1180073 [Mycena vulgaris]
MKSTTIATLLVLATGTIARNCTPDLDYCGRTLIDIGKYQDSIDQALADTGQGNANGGSDDLFHCTGDNGLIAFIEYCSNGCHDNGAGVSDACNKRIV